MYRKDNTTSRWRIDGKTLERFPRFSSSVIFLKRNMEHTRYKFVVHHMITSESVESEELCFSSPHYPSTKKDEDFIEGDLTHLCRF